MAFNDDELSHLNDTTDINSSYLRVLNQMAVSLIQINTIEDLLWYVAREVVGKLDFADCVIYLYDHELGKLVQTAAIGEKNPTENVILNKLQIPIGTGVTGSVAKDKTPVIIGDTSKLESYVEDLTHLTSEICVPLIYEDQLLGVIDSEHPEANYFNDTHLEILITIAALTSSKIIQCRDQAKLTTQANIIKQVSEAVMLIKKDGTITSCNEAAEVLLKIPKEEIIDSNIFSYVYHQELLRRIEPIARDEIRKHGISAGRIGIRQKDNSELQVEITIKELFEHDSKEAIYITVTRDISEQVKKERLERELQQAQKMESLGHLTGGIAHDFNNLLGIITGYSDLATHAAKEDTNPKLTNYIGHIMDASRRATNLVTQMLNFSRSTPSENKPLQLADVIQNDAAMLRATLPSSIDLWIKTAPNLPLVSIDPTKVHQLLMNLCVNARDAMHGEGKISIDLKLLHNLNTQSSISHRPIEGDWLELSITDTGSGIDKEHIAKIFNPFFTTKDVGHGTGMGLSVVYKIMEEQDGHILVESELGRGTTFKLLFKPIDSSSVHEDKKNEPDLIENVEEHGQRILIVDDEESLAQLLSRVFEENGYLTTAMTDSEKALNLIQLNPEQYDILITDQTMPKLTGMDLISAARNIRPDLAVILCSGYSDKIDANAARELNIPYFDKPIEMNKLLVTVSMLLEA